MVTVAQEACHSFGSIFSDRLQRIGQARTHLTAANHEDSMCRQIFRLREAHLLASLPSFTLAQKSIREESKPECGMPDVSITALHTKLDCHIHQ